MRRDLIEKPGPWPVSPNLADYERARREFSWSAVRAELDGLPGGKGLHVLHAGSEVPVGLEGLDEIGNQYDHSSWSLEKRLVSVTRSMRLCSTMGMSGPAFPVRM